MKAGRIDDLWAHSPIGVCLGEGMTADVTPNLIVGPPAASDADHLDAEAERIEVPGTAARLDCSKLRLTG
jgi:hypothetical protein